MKRKDYNFHLSLVCYLLNQLGISSTAALGYVVKRLGALILVVNFGGGSLNLSLVRNDFIVRNS
ncbi:MAG: hypothetical protein EA343_19345 [Nodularia sp. (in: Bacteria)]|nr:MAG: hypothetical protein EA343_19345 [Nodularia sp. (in: cyanobacteria)]